MQTAHPLPQSGAVSSLRTTRRRFPLWAWIVLALGFAMAVGLFFGIAPARSAARLDPIEALRQD